MKYAFRVYRIAINDMPACTEKTKERFRCVERRQARVRVAANGRWATGCGARPLDGLGKSGGRGPHTMIDETLPTVRQFFT